MSSEDSDWQEQLLRHLPYVRSVARRVVPKSDQEDFVQELTAKLLKRPPRDRRSVKAWLRRIVLHMACDQARARGLERLEGCEVDLLPASQGEEGETTSDQLEAVRTILKLLPERDRQILELYYQTGLTLAQISLRLNTPETTCRRRLDKTIALLRRRLNKPELTHRRGVMVFVLGAFERFVWRYNWRRILHPAGLAMSCALLLFVGTYPARPSLPKLAAHPASARVGSIEALQQRIKHLESKLSDRPIFDERDPSRAENEAAPDVFPAPVIPDETPGIAEYPKVEATLRSAALAILVARAIQTR